MNHFVWAPWNYLMRNIQNDKPVAAPLIVYCVFIYFVLVFFLMQNIKKID